MDGKSFGDIISEAAEKSLKKQPVKKRQSLRSLSSGSAKVNTRGRGPAPCERLQLEKIEKERRIRQQLDVLAFTKERVDAEYDEKAASSNQNPRKTSVRRNSSAGSRTSWRSVTAKIRGKSHNDDEMDDERKKHAAHGTKMHDHFANYILGKETQDEMEKSDLEVSRQFLAFWRDEKWIHFAPNSWLVEHDMKDADEKITGRLDFAADRRTGRIFASSVNFAASD
eukprot:GEMP01081768.1.p1 GENE.GEMP01081768.1~~GEMP01081768.1.p1  ORF type:complete len:225 (-),score=43.74 GEMP01081768.1:319-993(-)